MNAENIVFIKLNWVTIPTEAEQPAVVIDKCSYSHCIVSDTGTLSCRKRILMALSLRNKLSESAQEKDIVR
jgi:hypothetical protein